MDEDARALELILALARLGEVRPRTQTPQNQSQPRATPRTRVPVAANRTSARNTQPSQPQGGGKQPGQYNTGDKSAPFGKNSSTGGGSSPPSDGGGKSGGGDASGKGTA